MWSYCCVVLLKELIFRISVFIGNNDEFFFCLNSLVVKWIEVNKNEFSIY